MGLDMYLSATLFNGGGYDHSSIEEHIVFNDILRAVSLDREIAEKSLTLKVTVGYWRKANAIHAWFVQHCQDGVDECQESYVSRENLEELKKTCQKVLNGSKTEMGKVHVGTKYSPENGREELYEDGLVIVNHNLAKKLLPSTSGFFFGGTDYDQGYINDLKDTIAICEKCLLLPEKWSFQYHSSW